MRLFLLFFKNNCFDSFLKNTEESVVESSFRILPYVSMQYTCSCRKRTMHGLQRKILKLQLRVPARPPLMSRLLMRQDGAAFSSGSDLA